MGSWGRHVAAEQCAVPLNQWCCCRHSPISSVQPIVPFAGSFLPTVHPMQVDAIGGARHDDASGDSEVQRTMLEVRAGRQQAGL